MRAIAALVLGAGMIALPASAHRDPPRVEAAPGRSAHSTVPWLGVIRQAPDFSLVDTEGRRVRLAELRGQVVLLSFIFTRCSAACPMLSFRMSLLQQRLRQAGARGVMLLSVTVDPERDSSAALSQYAARFAADRTQWRFLRDEPQTLAPVLAAYGEWTQRLRQDDIDHPARIHLVDRGGNVREIYSLAFFDEAQAFLDIRALLRERQR